MKLLTIAPDGTATLHALRPLHVLRDIADRAENCGCEVRWIETADAAESQDSAWLRSPRRITEVCGTDR